VTHPHRTRWLAAAAVLAGLFVLLLGLVVVRYPPLMSFDARVVNAWAGAVTGTPWRGFFTAVAEMSQPWVVRAVLVVVCIACALRRARRTALWILTVLVVDAIAWGTLKQAVHRPRPDLLHQIAGWSFPSGHASDIAAGMGVLLVLTLAWVRRTTLRRALVATEIAVAVVVGCDRVFLGAHNPSDVVGGWLLGAAVVCGSLALFGSPTAAPAALSEPSLPSVPERHRTLGVVLNPTKVADSSAFKAQVSRAARTAGWHEPLWFETTVDDAGSAMARAAVAAGADVVIGNVGSLQAGIPLLPDALIDDGLLDVVVIAPLRLVGWLSLAWRVVTKHPRTDERLDRYTGRSVVVQAAHASPRQLDGDTVEPGLSLRASIEPGVLLVRVPR